MEGETRDDETRSLLGRRGKSSLDPKDRLKGEM